MKQYNLPALIASLKKSMLSYLCSSLPLGNHATQRALGKQFYARWEEDTFQGPYLESIPIYRTGASLAELFSNKRPVSGPDRRFCELCQPRYEPADLANRLSKVGVPLERAKQHLSSEDGLNVLWQRPLYEHQSSAIEHLTSNRGNLVVATGTGSGKTECFLIPLLYWLVTEPEQTRKQPGVRALLLFPMNALVEDQIRRLRAVLCWLNGQNELALPNMRLARRVTFGRYVGTTRLNSSDSSPERRDPDDHLGTLGEMIYREDMQKSPPDILITNFTMLEYMLLRNDDRKLFSRPDLFRMLVLDELHTYRGTQGMEVACLLRRLDDLLQRKSAGRGVSYARVGLSATLPSDAPSLESLAKFASDLFGVPFPVSSIIVEPPITGDSQGVTVRGPWPRAAAELNRLWEIAPALCKFFSVSCPNSTEGEEEPEEIPLEEWQLLAAALESSYTPSQTDLDNPRTEILGQILESSPIVSALKSIVRGDRVVGSASVAERLFGQSVAPAEREIALGVLLQLVCGGRVDETALLSLRAHFFVKEQREALLCINPAHELPDGTETDGWWKALYLVHHSECKTCGARVFPLNLCRRCGFVLLEAWIRKGCYFPEKDGLLPEGQFTRVLFRPLEGIPPSLHRRLTERPLDNIRVNEFRLCLKCGLRIFSGPHGDSAAARHPCGQAALLRIAELSSPGADVRILRCPHCAQEWYQDQEVYTPPSLSPYGAATVLLEETKRALDAPAKSYISKVLCFSDSRQQAAKIARRLERTNEDFILRQLIFQALRDSPHARLLTTELIQSICRSVWQDMGIASLLCERGESPHDRDLLKRRISSFLFRELCTEYFTLERMGIIQIGYPDEVENRGTNAIASHWLGRKLDATERRSTFHFLIDWIFRFNRWALKPCILDIEYERLTRYGYRDKTVALFGAQAGPMGFCLRMGPSTSRRYDFYQRVCSEFPSLSSVADLDGYNQLAEIVWEQAICHEDFLTRQGGRRGPDPQRPFIVTSGSQPADFQLKANFEVLSWRLTQPEEPIYRCNYCQYVTGLNVRNVCPVRGCEGKLTRVTFDTLKTEPFSPARHYIELVTQKDPKPLWVEEHTAQISPNRRADIEKDFRNDDPGSLDIISASTTFELGVDLGTINSIFLANLPPEVSNYRQRAGRAGRRPGMMAFILTYIRERPHDKYFWSNVREFIDGPLKVPWLAPPSREIVLRHANAVIFARLLGLYPAPSPLTGPPCGPFAAFCLNPAQSSRISPEAAAPSSELTQSLKSVLGINPGLGLTPRDCVKHFFEAVDFANSKYLTAHFDEGSINVFSDYGILPSYSFPIYVDEVVLYQKPRTERPRCDLKLQRDRRIALREYFPGRLIEADKWVLQSVGLRNGYAERTFGICRKCHHVSRTSVSGACGVTACDGIYQTCRVVIPRAGFLGQIALKPPPLDSSLFELQASEIIFDPAADPPPKMEPKGGFLRAARQSAAQMVEARMRMFSPRPMTSKGLEMLESTETDVTAGKPARCLVLPGKAATPRANQPREYYLMHEFTTDILRLQFSPDSQQLLLSAPKLQAAMASGEPEEREKAITIFRFTLGQVLTTGAALQLRIDPAELDFTFRFVPQGALLNREFIIFDTAPGGAGYASKCFEDSELKAIFEKALQVLRCNCGDSCYGCLRSYSNQWMHARLNHAYVREGLERFLGTNWR